jgi:hypothetical protein
MPKFILIIREDIRTSRPDNELKEIIDLHINWAKDLAQKGIFVDGYGLNGKGCMLELVDGEIITKDIPYPEIAFGGLYIINADNIEAAIEIGKQCPTFSIGDKIEVRELI